LVSGRTLQVVVFHLGRKWFGIVAGGGSTYMVSRRILGAAHRWALSPISVISDIGLSLISERPISD
jgi:hypothetical protein